MPDRPTRFDAWDDDDEASVKASKRLTREEARALAEKNPPVSPWRVVGAQVLLGAVLGLLAWLCFDRAVAWSVLYGAAAVALPGALMARGMTSRVTGASPVAGAAGFLVWEMVKVGVSVVMLMLAPKLVPQLSWPALLVAMLLCIKTYWFALLWRRAPVKERRVDG